MGVELILRVTGCASLAMRRGGAPQGSHRGVATVHLGGAASPAVPLHPNPFSRLAPHPHHSLKGKGI